MKSKILIGFFILLLLVLAGVYWEIHNNDDCPSLCKASSVAKQTREAMSLVETIMLSSNDSGQTKSFATVESSVSYRSPYIEKWTVKNDGTIVMVGPKELFMFTVQPISGQPQSWRCFGFPEKFLENIAEFFDAKKIGKCELKRAIVDE